MKVKTLIEKLKKHDPEATVVLSGGCTSADDLLPITFINQSYATYEIDSADEIHEYFSSCSEFSFYKECDENEEHAEKVVVLEGTYYA